jgi:tetratricopeptide (TPR) repeat protein
MRDQRQPPILSISGGAARLPVADLSGVQNTPCEENKAVASRGFVGRERELAELCAGLANARSGRGQLFLVTGDPGIGKTRLTDQVALYATSQAMIVLRAGCWEHDGAPAYWPFIQVIRGALQAFDRNCLEKLWRSESARHAAQELAQVIPELRSTVALPGEPVDQQLLNPEQARFRLFDSVATLLREFARLKPLMVGIEDLHDADLPSLMMLRFVVNQLKNASALLIGTYRDVEVRSSATLSQHLGELMREGIHIPLFGLTRENVSAIIEERTRAPINPKIVSELHQATAGNPLFVEGIIRALLAEGGVMAGLPLNLATFRVPDGVREAIRRWLALLPDRRPLVAAAAIARDFELRCLQRITQLEEEQLSDMLRQAAAVGLVIPTSQGTYRFSHVLIRNALYDELNLTDRCELHSQIGKVLEELYQPVIEMHLAELAYHFRQAGVRVKALDYSIRAGDAANAVFAYEEAASHWRTGLELIPAAPQERQCRADLLERLGELLGMSACEGVEQVRYLEQALRLYEDLGRVEAAARVHSRLAAWHIARSTAGISRTIEHNRKAQDLLSEGSEGFSSVLLYMGLATTAAEQMRYNEALTASWRAMDLSKRLGNETYWARAAIVRASAFCWSGRLAEAFALMGRVWAKAEQLDDTIAAFGATMTACSPLNWLLDPCEAAAWAERELAKPSMSQASFLQKGVFDNLGLSQVLMGKLAEAGALVAQAQGGPVLEERLLEGQLAFYQGEWERAEMVFTQALNQEFQADRLLRSCICGHLVARVLRTRGRRLEAESILEKDIAMCAEGPGVLIEMATRQELVLVCVDTGRLDQAQIHVARSLEILAVAEDWRGLAGNVLRARAVLAAAEKRFEEAQSQFTKALEIYRCYQVPFEEAETLHYWGRALLAAGQQPLGVEKLEAAIEIFQRHGGGKRWTERVLADMPRANGAGAVAQAETAAPSLSRMSERPRNRNQEERAEQNSPQGIFRKEGEYWSLSFSGSEFRLRETKGLHYIAYLLRHPGQEFPVQDLVSAMELGISVSERANRIAAEDHRAHTIAGNLGDAGIVLDSKAKEQYRRRLEDLREELESAEWLNDLGRAAKARVEIEFLDHQLAAAVGLRGRNRKTVSHLERARVMVTKTVKSAVRRIRQADPELGRHLGLSIRTGYFCTYIPRDPINWQL